MTDEPTFENDDELRDRIDAWASALVDGDISIDDVDTTARDVVGARAEEFRRGRRMLLDSFDTTVDDFVVTRASAVRSARPARIGIRVVALTAAASVFTLIGVAIGSAQNGSDSTKFAEVADAEVTDGGVVATEAPLAAPVMESVAAEKSADAGVEAPASPMVASADGATCADGSRPVIIPEAVIEGERVEIHWSAGDGVVVYRLSDCSVVFAMTP
ncbi:MAG: hypothetical protein ACKODY_10615 [Actinomycetota bacterium]